MRHPREGRFVGLVDVDTLHRTAGSWVASAARGIPTSRLTTDGVVKDEYLGGSGSGVSCQ